MTETVDSPEQQLDRAIAALGTFEVRGEMERIYFDDLPGWLQLEFELDSNGKVVAGTRKGEPMALAAATRISNELKHGQIYYDVAARVFRGPGLTSSTRADLESAILARANEAVAAGDGEAPRAEPPS